MRWWDWVIDAGIIIGAIVIGMAVGMTVRYLRLRGATDDS